MKLELELDGKIETRGEGEAIAIDQEIVSESLEGYTGKTVTMYLEIKGDEVLCIADARTMVCGTIKANYSPRYSEITGFLWLDEEASIGSVEILEILEESKGRSARLEVWSDLPVEPN